MIKKEKFRHFLLNQLTIANLLTQAGDLTEQEKERLSHSLRITNLLITFEDIFLGAKIDLYKEKVDLKEVIDTTISSFDFVSKNYKFTSVNKKIIVKVDRHYFSKAIDLIFKKLLTCTSFIEFKFDDGALSIMHNCGNLDTKQDKELIDYCNGDSDKLGFHIGLKILELQDIKVSSVKNIIKLSFPK